VFKRTSSQTVYIIELDYIFKRKLTSRPIDPTIIYKSGLIFLNKKILKYKYFSKSSGMNKLYV